MPFPPPRGTSPIAVLAANFGGPGADIVTPDQTSNQFSILPNNGSGVFGTGTAFTTGTTPAGLCTGDFDRNGANDLAVVNQGSNSVSIFLGVSGQADKFTTTGSFAARHLFP